MSALELRKTKKKIVAKYHRFVFRAYKFIVTVTLKYMKKIFVEYRKKNGFI